MDDVMSGEAVETQKKAGLLPLIDTDLHGKPNLTADDTDNTDLHGSRSHLI